MKTSVTTVLLLGLLISLKLTLIKAGTIASSSSAEQNLFAADLLSVIVDKRSSENVVYSPASIQTALALAYMGAEGETQEEMRKALKIGQVENKSVVAQRYGNFLKSSFGKSKEKAPQLKMANRLYVNDHLKVLPQYNKIAQDNFQAKTETLDFTKGKEVAQKINKWVEQETENKIKNLLQPDAVNNDTSAILVNAIYFKGIWFYPFSNESTTKRSFYINNKESQQVDMMFQDGSFGYVQLRDLKASALELSYENSDISMLIILPNDKEGLAALEQNLKGVDLNDITKNMNEQNVEVYLPKFRIEFNIDLKEPLRELGLNSMFSNSANFRSLFDSAVPQKISEIKHKAFLEVNEAGSEAYAATKLTLVPHILSIKFIADHPFFFAIRSKTSVYFAGHVVKFE
ncbi:serine protease inhibitor 42Dd-like isoform 1-T1 [Cochliomyia hominivorax]